jgi:hypothetical protein
MNISTTSKVNKGSMLALGAAALILAGCASAGQKEAASGGVACAGINGCKGQSACKTVGHECKGQNSCKTANNACKGQGSCKTAGNGCKGQNACKGQGFLQTATSEECATKGGHVI